MTTILEKARQIKLLKNKYKFTYILKITIFAKSLKHALEETVNLPKYFFTYIEIYLHRIMAI